MNAPEPIAPPGWWKELWKLPDEAAEYQREAIESARSTMPDDEPEDLG